MIPIARILATVLGIGYMKGGGTVASVVLCILWMFFPPDERWQPVMMIAVTGMGVWSAGCMEKIWDHDSNRIVIDEVAGMMLTILLIPQKPLLILTGCILFRFFDIAKPLGIKTMEKLPGGWGVMADDLLAGVYSQVVLRAIVLIKIW